MNIALIEDEYLSREALKEIILLLKPDSKIVGEASSVKSGIALLQNIEVDLVFLDINLPDGDSFQILEKLAPITFQVVFVTAHNEFALKAFDFSATHYIMKPINPVSIKEALERTLNRNNNNNNDFNKKIDVLKNSLEDKNKHLALATQDKIDFVEIEDIIYFESDSSYSFVYLKDDVKKIVSKPLGFYEKLLEDQGFIRIHHKYLINILHFKQYKRGRGGVLVLSNDAQLEVSSRRKKNLLQHLKSNLFFSFF